MTNPTVDRVSTTEPLVFGASPVNEDASDGPVDGWVDDVDGDWDDILVHELLASERLVVHPEQVPPEQ